MLFSIREEYLAGITEFESVIPEILANRIRIERMTRHNAMQVIEGPCRINKIQVEEGFADTLLEILNPESNEVELTYLQVFLDKIFRTSQNDRGGLHFTLEMLHQVGDVSDLLGSFLEEQVRNMEDPETALTILKAFVSVLDNVYETGKKVTKGFKENMKIVFDAFLPQWNYRAIPQNNLQVI